MIKDKIREMTISYEEWLIDSLTDKEEAIAYLEGAFEEYQKDADLDVLLLALRHVAKAQGLSYKNLEQSFSHQESSQLHAIGLVLQSLGFELAIRAKS